jgi:hypothetical protein
VREGTATGQQLWVKWTDSEMTICCIASFKIAMSSMIGSKKGMSLSNKIPIGQPGQFTANGQGIKHLLLKLTATKSDWRKCNSLDSSFWMQNQK